jgi:hypothetical protein
VPGLCLRAVRALFGGKVVVSLARAYGAVRNRVPSHGVVAYLAEGGGTHYHQKLSEKFVYVALDRQR